MEKHPPSDNERHNPDDEHQHNVEWRVRREKIFASALALCVHTIREPGPHSPGVPRDEAAQPQRRIRGARHDDDLKHVAQRERDDQQTRRRDGDILRVYGEGLALGVGVSAGIGVAGPAVGVGVAGGGAVDPPVSGMMRKYPMLVVSF